MATRRSRQVGTEDSLLPVDQPIRVMVVILGKILVVTEVAVPQHNMVVLLLLIPEEVTPLSRHPIRPLAMAKAVAMHHSTPRLLLSNNICTPTVAPPHMAKPLLQVIPLLLLPPRDGKPPHLPMGRRITTMKRLVPHNGTNHLVLRKQVVCVCSRASLGVRLFGCLFLSP